MTTLKDQLLDLVGAIENDWTAEEIMLAKDVAKDYAALIAGKVAGDDIAVELAHVQAQAASLMAAGTISLANVIEEEVSKFLTQIISDLVPGL